MARWALEQTNPSWRRATIVGAIGLMGVLSLLASDVVPPDVARETGIPAALLKLLILIQPTLLVIGAAIVGDRLTGTTWLQAPLLSRTHAVRVTSIIASALIGAVVVGGVLTIYTWITTEVSPTTLVSGTSLSLLTGVLYGGLTEEVLMRWGLMSFVIWMIVRMQRRSSNKPPTTTIIVIAILSTAAVFALLHLPALLSLTDPSLTVIAAAMVANMVAGTVFGYLFAARGLEAAMGAHAGGHVVGTLLIAVTLG